jgi:hypothetical protein
VPIAAGDQSFLRACIFPLLASKFNVSGKVSPANVNQEVVVRRLAAKLGTTETALLDLRLSQTTNALSASSTPAVALRVVRRGGKSSSQDDVHIAAPSYRIAADAPSAAVAEKQLPMVLGSKYPPALSPAAAEHTKQYPMSHFLHHCVRMPYQRRAADIASVFAAVKETIAPARRASAADDGGGHGGRRQRGRRR